MNGSKRRRKRRGVPAPILGNIHKLVILFFSGYLGKR